MRAIMAAAREMKAPVILAASESALLYMGDDFAKFIANSSFILHPSSLLHLDHGKSFEICKHAIKLGFQSVMIDGSHLPFEENIKLTKKVVDFAHKRNVLVEAELGVLCGTEDDVKVKGLTKFTNPKQAKDFVKLTNCDSLAIAIGTSHGAYKGVDGKGLRVDILKEIRRLLPKTPLVLHGASQIPEKYTKILGIKNAGGIPKSEIRRAVKAGINKVNVDSDSRLAWTASMKRLFSKQSDNFDPRHYLTQTTIEMIKLYKEEIKLISGFTVSA